ncbi:Double RNA binding domain protein 7 [Novymonas esmeraldas]|uniref:Double RNA binding domain protein 7 n=1 Tax=Novymonas esmeraldas TaxID=1808958 RepID=A0AAW0ESW1_9TRYP
MESRGMEAGSYKPSLRVDIGSADNAKEESSNATGTSPQKAITPHVSTNIFVAGIPSLWDDEALRDRYKEFGEIVSTKVVKNRHFGFVMFRKADSAHAAINATHLTQPTPQSTTVLHVSIAMHDEGLDDQPNDRLFIRGLPQWATKEHLRQMFSPYGVITECAVLMNPLGQCKGSGFVQFSSQQDATAAIRARDSISIDDWPHQLEVKYSESAEVRQMRQERNRNRQRHWLPSPQYRGNNNNNNNSTPSSLPSPYPSFSPPLSVIPSPQGFPVMNAMPFPMVYPPTPSTTGAPTQIVYPQPIYQSMSPFFSASAVPLPAPIPLPQKGDLHFSGPPLTEELLRLLLHSYGDVEAIKKLDNDSGIAVRMRDTTKHALVVQQLNGSLFPTGQLLAVGMYA